MSNPTGRPKKITTSKQKRKPKKQKRKRRSFPKVTCVLCGKKFRTISDEHLQEHGYTRAMYGRIFSEDGGALRVTRARGGSYSDTGAASGQPGELISSIASMLARDDLFVQTLADDVASALVGGPLRDRIRLALLGTLAARVELQGQAVTRLAKLNAELSEPWRTNQGGTNGGPTPTKDLVMMASQTLHEIKTGEDAVLRAAKLAIEEMKIPEPASKRGNPLDAYSGDAEQLDIPAEIPPAEREIMRNLLQALASGGRAKQSQIEGDQARPVVPEAVRDATGHEATTAPLVDEPQDGAQDTTTRFSGQQGRPSGPQPPIPMAPESEDPF